MKKKLIAVFCILLGLSWYSAISDAVGNPKKLEAHVKKAEELEAKGIYVDAIEEYENALQYSPDNIEISLKMAEDYLQIGSSKKFITICQNIAEVYPDDASALNRMMNYYVENGEESSAVKYLNDFTDQYPKNETARQWLVQLEGSYSELFCHYEELSEIFNDSMVVYADEQYGLTDGMGSQIISTEYEELHPYSEDDLALAKKDGQYIYIDTDGQTRLVADESYQDLGMMSSDRTTAEVNGKYGYLDEKLEPVTDFTWDQLSQIFDGIGAAKQGDKWALVDKNGKEKTEYLYDDVVMDAYGFCIAQDRIFVKEQGSYHLVNKKGKVIGDLSFEDVKCFGENGYAAVCKNGKWGFVDSDGNLMIEYQYEDAQSFSNGFAAVCVNGKWGYIDLDGNMAIEPQFEQATAISSDGTAAVKADEWKLIQLSVFL